MCASKLIKHKPMLSNLYDPAILFFVFGITAGLMKSNLTIPDQIAKFLSLYLLMSIGLKGGFSLAKTGFDMYVMLSLAAAMVLALLTPALGYALLRRFVNPYDAAAMAAAYGSVSAVTFIAASQFLATKNIEFGGHMSVALVLMESPAIIMAIALANHARGLHNQSKTETGAPAAQLTPKHILHEAFTDGAHLMLLGSLAIGFITGDAGKAVMEPFAGGLFKGLLSLFLLDMGLRVAAQLGKVITNQKSVIVYAALAPFAHASLAIGIAMLFGLSRGDSILLAVLAASASYIVVPAAIRYAIPEANQAIYLGMPLGVTFPVNLIIGIPLYAWAVDYAWQVLN